jgi:cobyric acid synthase
MDAATVAETTVASLEGLSVPIVIVDVLKGHCFLSLAGTVVLRTCRARIL